MQFSRLAQVALKGCLCLEGGADVSEAGPGGVRARRDVAYALRDEV